MVKKILIFLMSLVGFLSLIYSHNIKQKNPETIFLTESILKDYKAFQKDVLEKHSLVIKRDTADKGKFYQELEKIESFCIDDCEVITQKKLKNQRGGGDSLNNLMVLSSDSFEAALILDNNDEIQKKILAYTEKNSYWNNSKTSFAGIPYTNYLLDKYSLDIQEKLFPIMFTIGFLICLIFIGHLQVATVVYLPCLFSAGFSLAFLKIYYGQMNMVTSIIPLVVFTVSLSLSFHLYFSLKELTTLKNVFKVKWAPIFLMMFTTYIGFLSLGRAEISVIRIFGLVSSQLVLFSTFFSFAWYFLWEEFLSLKKEIRGAKILPSFFFSYSLKRYIIVCFSLASICCAIFIPKKLDVITDATLYFPKETKIREKILEVTNSVSGMPIMEILVSLKHDLNQVSIFEMERVEEGIHNLNLSQPYGIISNNSLVKKANYEYSGNYRIPQNNQGYFLLRGQLPSSLQESYPIEAKYRMSLLGSPINVKEYLRDLDKIKKYLKLSKSNYEISGIHHNLMVSQNSMIDVLASSFISSAVVIFIFSAFFLKSIKDNFIFIFITLLPIGLTFGVIYLLGFSINIATVMTFSISLGLVGDSSFHIIYAKKNRFSNFKEYSRAVLLPVIGSGILLFICFGMFTLNSFLPIRQFGGILAMIVLFGTIADLYILPTLLYGTHKHQEAYDHLAG